MRSKTAVSRFAKIGEACILNMGVLVDHHVEVGEDGHILMGAVLKNRVIGAWAFNDDFLDIHGC